MSYKPRVYNIEKIAGETGVHTLKSEKLKPEFRGDWYCLVVVDKSGIFDQYGTSAGKTPEQALREGMRDFSRLKANVRRLRLYFGCNSNLGNVVYHFLIDEKASAHPEKLHKLDALLKAGA